jgi:hypothetical protein
MSNILKVITGSLACLCISLIAQPATGLTVDQYGHVAIPIDNNLRNIGATGTQLVLGDDDTAVDVPIGFDFQFYGNTYSTVSIRSNGYMGFTPGPIVPTIVFTAALWTLIPALQGLSIMKPAELNLPELSSSDSTLLKILMTLLFYLHLK